MFVSGPGETIRRQALSSKRLASFFATAAPFVGHLTGKIFIDGLHGAGNGAEVRAT